MKKLIIVSMLNLIFCLGFFHAITSSIAIAQVDSLVKSEQANCRIGRYVIGSGGVLGATSANNRHHATMGQTLVGGSQSTNHILRSGFWLAGGGPVGIHTDEPIALPTEFQLHQNYPNPFNHSTTIEFALPKSAFVTLKIFDLLGEEVATLIAEQRAAGIHQLNWDARGLASGVYLYRLEAGKFVQVKKLILMR